jgi:uroporphyrinogen decarboxylase
VGSDVFRRRFHGEDSLRTHVKLCREMGMDFLSLPMEMPSRIESNYRRFNLEEIREAVATSGLFTCVVIDGPFQQLTQRWGYLSSLAALSGDSGPARLEDNVSMIEEAIAASVDREVNAVVIADDIAYQRSTYASPGALRERLFPFYSRLVSGIHKGGAHALFHSDGNIAALIPDLIHCRFDGLAGCEPECLDLISLKRTHGSQITFMTGIRADLLETASLASAQREGFLTEVRALGQGGGFVLCSACGLNSEAAVESLKALYACVDEAV